jgi:hypothetical protein
MSDQLPQCLSSIQHDALEQKTQSTTAANALPQQSTKAQHGF